MSSFDIGYLDADVERNDLWTIGVSDHIGIACVDLSPPPSPP